METRTSPGSPHRRRLPVGAEPAGDGSASFRVWAPRRSRVTLALEAPTRDGGSERTVRLEREDDGYFSAHVADVPVGSRYGYRLDDDERVIPDPASRYQPQGPHERSVLVDPAAFEWTDAAWSGAALPGQVVYEMHVGTFTKDGTWAAAARELPSLADLGITVVEVMPIAEFPGTFGWGYDGVDLFAPTHLYGAPDDFRRFVDRAHAAGIAIILDVVYNHFGPDGNYLREFAAEYFNPDYGTDWGDAVNYDGERSAPVREFVLANVDHWIREYHLDGVRVDATQSIFDRSATHILAAIADEVRSAAGGRDTIVIGENEPQHTYLLRPRAEGGCGFDALWNDDFHHSAIVALTGRDEAYYSDHRGRAQEFVSAAKYGYLYQGQFYSWQRQRRGTPAFGLPPSAFVHFIQNHDQVANSFAGHRISRLTSPGRLRAMTALLLLGPQPPMLFQGQEFAASSPFLYFADHEPGLAALVREGRAEFLSQFPSIVHRDMLEALPDPADPQMFERSKLDHGERERHAEAYALHRDLLHLRREDPVFRAPARGSFDGAVLGESTFVLRYFGGDAGDRLLMVNFGPTLHYDPAPEPLLAPTAGTRWDVRWSSEDRRYGGMWMAPVETMWDNWRVPPESAVVLVPRKL